jgi:hypothetical protein
MDDRMSDSFSERDGTLSLIKRACHPWGACHSCKYMKKKDIFFFFMSDRTGSSLGESARLMSDKQTVLAVTHEPLNRMEKFKILRFGVR